MRSRLLLLAVLAGCGDDLSRPGGTLVGSIDVVAARTSLAVGDTLRLGTVVRDEDGRPLERVPLAWSSSDEAVARVDDSGLVTAIAPGSVRVTAAAGDRSDRVDLEVVATAASPAPLGDGPDPTIHAAIWNP